jgi:DNA-binding transcriptional ArsR family regulator
MIGADHSVGGIMSTRSRRISLPVFNDSLQSEHCAQLLKAIADPARLRIIEVLRPGAKSVGEIAAALDMELVNVSHHLGILQRAGFTERRREGRHIIYHLVDGVLEAGRGGTSDQRINLGCCQVVVPKAQR